MRQWCISNRRWLLRWLTDSSSSSSSSSFSYPPLPPLRRQSRSSTLFIHSWPSSCFTPPNGFDVLLAGTLGPQNFTTAWGKEWHLSQMLTWHPISRDGWKGTSDKGENWSMVQGNEILENNKKERKENRKPTTTLIITVIVLELRFSQRFWWNFNSSRILRRV